MMDTLLPREDPDVASAFTDLARRRWEVLTGYRATAVERTDDGVVVHAETAGGDTATATGDELLVAAGRRPNTDTVAAEAGGIETDDRGFVVTDDYLATSAENVWAVGDVVGRGPHLFKHAADYEVEVAIDNVLGRTQRALDYTAMGHAVFTDPQVGGVGATESALREAGTEYVVGRAAFADTAMGRAKGLEHGFVKVLAAPDGAILGCHVLGYEASTLVHEAILAMRLGGTVQDVSDAIYVHPSLSKVVWKAFRDAADGL
jgi:dihydrolipoamide dehydrogenase